MLRYFAGWNLILFSSTSQIISRLTTTPIATLKNDLRIELLIAASILCYTIQKLGTAFKLLETKTSENSCSRWIHSQSG